MFALSTRLRAVKYYSVRNTVVPRGYSRPAATMSDVPVPAVPTALAAEIAARHYGVVAAAERLAAQVDDTFRLVGADGSAWLLKIGAAPAPARARAGGAYGAGGVGLQTAVLLHLASV